MPAPTGGAIAGWEQLTLNLSAGAVGLRTILVVLDASHTPISANDAVFYRLDPSGAPAAQWDGPALLHQDSIGGRFESDGRFGGTRWLSQAAVSAPEEEPKWEFTRLAPTEEEIAALRLLVAEMVRRGPPSPLNRASP